MEAYTHYGKQADVFKHLVLCEVLKNEMPTVYIDTNSACAVYQLEHTLEQDYGIITTEIFLSIATFAFIRKLV